MKKKKIELEITEGLLSIITTYTEEMEIDINEFIIKAIIRKFNTENRLFACKVDENGIIEK